MRTPSSAMSSNNYINHDVPRFKYDGRMDPRGGDCSIFQNVSANDRVILEEKITECKTPVSPENLKAADLPPAAVVLPQLLFDMNDNAIESAAGRIKSYLL
jgi:hypothetical protein